jgi:hypothetical protein
LSHIPIYGQKGLFTPRTQVAQIELRPHPGLPGRTFPEIDKHVYHPVKYSFYEIHA